MLNHGVPGTAAILHGLAVALGVGLLMGVERERHRSAEEQWHPAGVRSFALVGLAGGIAGLLGVSAVLLALASVGLLAALAYWRTSLTDPGLTTEVALVLCCLIGALAASEPALAAGVGVVAALLLAAKGRLHQVSREVISETELRDGMLLAAAALVVLPLLPNHALDPLGLFNPAAVWRLVVLIMAIGALGHLALRVFGARWGWVLAGFFAGYVSSTAAVLSYAGLARSEGRFRSAAGAALAANLASLSLFVPVLAAVSLSALMAVWKVLLAAMLSLLVTLLYFHLRGGREPTPESASTARERRMFNPMHALSMAAVLSGVMIGAGLIQRWLGSDAALVTAVIAGSVEVHSATATLGQLHGEGLLPDARLRLGLAAILVVSGLLKTALAFGGGPRGYGWRVGIGMAAMACGACVAAFFADSAPA